MSTTLPSFTHFDVPGGFRLAINSNKKMKTVLVLASFVGNLDETVTRKAILPMILRRGTRTRPDMQAISRYLEDLYGASLGTYVQKVGEWHILRFRLEVVNERFVPGEAGILRRAVEFLHEVIEDPLLVDGGFHPQYLEQEKNNLKLSIETLVDNKDAYAAQRLNEEMCPGEPYRLYENGRVEDIPAIEAQSLRELHRAWAREYPLHVYIAGDIDIGATRDLMADVLGPSAEPRTGGYPLTGIPAPVPVGAVRQVTERMDVNQARLNMGFRHGITFADPLYEALLVANGVLGAPGFPHSKLFQNVRERASLAYSVHSGVERTKGLLYIAAGVAPDKHAEAADIILEQVRSLQEGRISDEEIASTVALILNSNEMLEDNLGALADVDFTWRLHGRAFDFLEFREKIRKVRREDIVEVARRTRHDTTFVLTAEGAAHAG